MNDASAKRSAGLRRLLGASQSTLDFRGNDAPKVPLYPRLLHLQHIHPNSWQRAMLGEGMIGAGALLAMADLASAWSMAVLPVAVGGVVKAHDVIAGRLQRS
jgi:hypothetical protein